MSDNSNTTSPVPAPTPADLARDLAADLRAIEPFRVPEWSPNTLADAAIAAIRRALHAEAECERLRDTMRRAANAIRLGLTVTGIKSKGLETIADALQWEGDVNG